MVYRVVNTIVGNSVKRTWGESLPLPPSLSLSVDSLSVGTAFESQVCSSAIDKRQQQQLQQQQLELCVCVHCCYHIFHLK